MEEISLPCYSAQRIIMEMLAEKRDPFYARAMHFVDGKDEDTEYSYDANGNMMQDDARFEQRNRK